MEYLGTVTNNKDFATKEYVDAHGGGGTPTYTPVTGKPTANQTPSFGSTFTVSQISQDSTGQITATDRTVKIPNTLASATANGLMPSNMYSQIDNELWRVSGFSWTADYIEAGQTSVSIDCSFYELASAEEIICVNAVDTTTHEPVIVDWHVDVANYALVASIASAYTHDIWVRVYMQPTA